MVFLSMRLALGFPGVPGAGTLESAWACFAERLRPGPLLDPLLELWEEDAGNLGVKGFRAKASGR